FSGSAFAYVNGSTPSNFKTYSRYDQSGSFMSYGGQFTYTVNSNTTTTMYLCSGYNSTVAVLQGFSVWFDIQPNSETQDIIDNQNSNTQAEIDADKENTQAIIDNQNELAEQEKQEITDSGNQATDAGDSIPNESDGFIDALGTFVDTMSTTSTECSLTFPAIKIPEFAGIPATTLSEESVVDISAAVGLIPENIMKLIQAITTIGLIVFCFKELYDTISEALTSKKANSDG
ncbi:MAG: hypothetical protein IJY79_03600, partial [Clostridia bacterium]|nr:hypothetical protein [Clostridia bacterium]